MTVLHFISLHIHTYLATRIAWGSWRDKGRYPRGFLGNAMAQELSCFMIRLAQDMQICRVCIAP